MKMWRNVPSHYLMQKTIIDRESSSTENAFASDKSNAMISASKWKTSIESVIMDDKKLTVIQSSFGMDCIRNILSRSKQ